MNKFYCQQCKAVIHELTEVVTIEIVNDVTKYYHTISWKNGNTWYNNEHEIKPLALVEKEL